VLNQLAVEKAGLKDAVGKSFAVGRRQGTVVGVVKNTICHSLRLEPRPEVYYLIGDFAEECADGTVFIRIRGGRPLSAVMAHIEEAWAGVNSYAPFEYHFLDQQIDAQYGSEQRLGKLFGAFALLAVFISCLGLLGLVAFTAERRTKEIGIRKALGASVTRIVSLLCREYLVLVVLANGIAWPIAYITMSQWLEGFVCRADLGVGFFLSAGLAALLIALLTVSVLAIRAARANPVDSLRYE
jgi:ABC-type antimicrobial peptide transport system permease subunit